MFGTGDAVSYLRLDNGSTATTAATGNVTGNVDVYSRSTLNLGANLSLSGYLNVQDSDSVLNMGGQLLTLRFGREDESEADLIGLELAARAGYDPHAGVSLWTKMADASQGAPPQFLSTHPSGPTRIRDIERNIPQVEGLYQRAPKPAQRFEPPPQKSAKKPTTPPREQSR